MLFGSIAGFDNGRFAQQLAIAKELQLPFCSRPVVTHPPASGVLRATRTKF